MTQKDFPADWSWFYMLDLIDYEGGSQPPKSVFVNEPTDGYIRLCQIRDFGDKPFPTYVPDSKRLKRFGKNDLLLARYGGSGVEDSLGRICTGLEGAYNVALAKLVFDQERLNTGYVRYLFQGPWFREVVGNNSRSCQTGFNRDDLKEIQFPLPPTMEQQQRIVAKLDQVTARIDDAKARLDTIPNTLKRFRQSILAAACSGRLTAEWRISNSQTTGDIADVGDGGGLPELPSTWQYQRLGNLLRGLKYGTSQKCEYEKKGKPVLRIPNIGDGLLLSDDLKYAELPEKEYQQLALQAGDILLIRSNGSVSLVGKTALVTAEFAGYAYAGYLIRLRPSEEVRSDYLNHVLASMWLRQQIEIPARSTSGVNNINSEEVKNLLVPLPPMDEQTEIVRRVEALFKQADTIQARYNKARKFVEKLTPSLLAKAFRGELV